MTARQQHTPEPWELSLDHEAVVIRRDNGWATVADCFDADREGFPETRKANARRIVACVNACAGLSNEQLEASRLSENGNAVHSIVRALDDQTQSVIAQRDTLAAALRKIMNAHNSGNNGAFMGEAHVCAAFAMQANEALATL